MVVEVNFLWIGMGDLLLIGLSVRSDGDEPRS